jgi:hypothetical protein
MKGMFSALSGRSALGWKKKSPMNGVNQVLTQFLKEYIPFNLKITQSADHHQMVIVKRTN